MSPEEVIRRRAVVHGHVQGVFFRDSTRRRAEVIGVTGWACNRPDGAVEAVLEGDAASVERMLDYLRSGPARANVDRVEVSEEPPEGLRGFEIR